MFFSAGLEKFARVQGVAFVLAILGTSSVSGVARADEHAAVDRPRGGRTMNGHTFIPFRTVDWPFVATSFGTTTGAGAAKLITPGERDAHVAAFRQSFALEVAATRWLGFELGGGAFLLSGVNGPGALNVGAALAYGAKASVVARLYRSRFVYLSVRVAGEALRTAGIVPSRLVDTSSEGAPSLADPRISGRFLRVAGVVNMAIAALPWLGFQTSLAVLGHSVESERERGHAPAVRGSLGVELDFAPFEVPFALFLGGRVVHTGDVEVQVVAIDPVGRTQGALELGLFYSGRQNMVLGLSTVGHFATNDRRFGPEVVFRYFW